MSSSNFWVSILLIVLLTFRYSLFCYSTRSIEGMSMDPALKDGDIIYASSILPYIQEIYRGDIVGITTKINNVESRIIKRVIGLPGEHVELKNGKLYINGKILVEPYLADGTFTEGEFNYLLDKDQYIVLGDNRPGSLDSRDERIGIINKNEIDFVYLKVKENINNQ